MNTLAILGDLHFEPKRRKEFEETKKSFFPLKLHHIFTVGDVGGYSYSGSRQSFEDAKFFMDSFQIPHTHVLGNHDLESEEFDSDKSAVDCFLDIFKMKNPWTRIDCGRLTFLCLSTEFFRDIEECCHEVRISDLQYEWLVRELEATSDRQVAVISHAPFLGSGIRVLQDLHLRMPNAWLNHCDRPERFYKLLERFPHIRLWFSGHTHMSHRYPDALSVRGNCLCVHCGTLGPVARDGIRQSRILQFDDQVARLSTLNHEDGELLPDAELELPGKITIQRNDSFLPPSGRYFPPPPFDETDFKMQLKRSAFITHRDMLVEYDLETRSPFGVVMEHLKRKPVRVKDGRLEAFVPEDSGFGRRAKGSFEELPPGPSGRYSRIHYKKSKRDLI